MGVASVGTRHRAHDRQAESAAAVPAACRRAAEALEGPTGKLLGEARSAIENMDLDGPVSSRRLDLDRPGAVAQGVVDHAPDRLIETKAVGVEVEAGGSPHLDSPPSLLGAA